MKITRALLILPPCPIPKMFPKRVQMPLGIAYLAAALRKEGMEVTLIDSLVEGWDTVVELDPQNVSFGLTSVEIAERAAALSPDIIGISCMFSVQAGVTGDVAAEIKKRLPSVPIVVGGAHPTAMPDEVIKDKNIDFVVLGEGERTFTELISALNEGFPIENIDGISYRKKDGVIVHNRKTKFIEDVDSIPSPALDLLPVERYFEINRPHGTVTKSKRVVPIVTSRGCPASCIFCSIHPIWGKRYRARSAKSVVAEIEKLVKEYNVEEIHIEDDNFTFDKKRAEKICDLLSERGIKIAIAAPNGLAIWALDRDLLQKLKRAGFYRLTLAAESGSQETLSKIIHKPLKLERVFEVIKDANAIGFDIDIFFVVGFPGETPEEMQKTFDLGKSLDVSSVKYFIATPYPGTELLEISRRDGLIPPDYDPTDISVNVVHGVITTKDFTPEGLEQKVLKETMNTQKALFLKHPVRYATGFFKDYVVKDPGATLTFVWKTVKSKLCVTGDM